MPLYFHFLWLYENMYQTDVPLVSIPKQSNTACTQVRLCTNKLTGQSLLRCSLTTVLEIWSWLITAHQTSCPLQWLLKFPCSNQHHGSVHQFRSAMFARPFLTWWLWTLEMLLACRGTTPSVKSSGWHAQLMHPCGFCHGPMMGASCESHQAGSAITCRWMLTVRWLE